MKEARLRYMLVLSYVLNIMERYRLPDTAFLLIVRFDSLIRLENTLHVVKFLNDNFEAHICLWEFAPYRSGIVEKLIPDTVDYNFREDRDPILHRTRHLNEMLRSVSESYVSVWDVDVVAPVAQVVESVEKLRKGVDFVYPYHKLFLDTSEIIRELYIKCGDIDILMRYKNFMVNLYVPNPVGGAFFANKEAYLKSGGENENFYGWGMEDGERYGRWESMGLSIEHVEGPIFHLTHPRGVNSEVGQDYHYVMKRRELIKNARHE